MPRSSQGSLKDRITCSAKGSKEGRSEGSKSSTMNAYAALSLDMRMMR